MPLAPAHPLRIRGLLASSAALLLVPALAHADLAITPANAGRGFVVTSYATGFSNSGTYGPVGVAFLANQHVLVTDTDNGVLYGLPSHTDGQAVVTADSISGYTSAVWALAQVQIAGTWHVFGSDLGNFLELDPASGAVTRTIYGAGGYGIAPVPPGVSGPNAGHLFVGGGGFLWNVDPVAWSATPVAYGLIAYGDGIAISPDGSLLYIVRSDSLYAINTTTWGNTFTGLAHAGEGFDGIALGVGSLAGYVYVNCNNGDLWEFGLAGGPHAGVDHVLASGGTRGDFIAVDPNVRGGNSSGYPTLLLTQTDRLVRLAIPGGGWFGPPTSSTAAIGMTLDAPPPASSPTRLAPVAPNPARGRAEIAFTLAADTAVRLSVFDLAGREVAVLADGPLGAGTHQVEWRGLTTRGAAADGVYFVRLRAAGATATRRIAWIR